MNRLTISIAVSALLWGCGGSFPEPTQRLADAQSAARSAAEVGANGEPSAQLSLKLAQEQITKAKTAIANGDNRKADQLLIRARADAELAIAQAREKGARTKMAEAISDSADQREQNNLQGAVK
jgi:uncharacterized protein YqfA (UPF0365 family)